ncbi:hypothetical protein E3E31_00035 [Thermococcus sp. M39]|uniref:hypothetical protein n=1 Tax=Thermococcus sp. M39 TaxID=1638262 RepID=UPI001439A167|nr:hypothetical protein [Thermococcus sp. M39]NJE06945.1 hypothetical protein [Thermococcus sp. M39]
MTVVVPLKIPLFPQEALTELSELLMPKKLQPLAITLHRLLMKKREIHLLELIELAIYLSGDKELEEELKELVEGGTNVRDILQRLNVKSAENGSNFNEKWLEVKKVVERFAEIQLVEVNDSWITYTPEKTRKLFMMIAELI